MAYYIKRDPKKSKKQKAEDAGNRRGMENYRVLFQLLGGLLVVVGFLIYGLIQG